MAARTLKLKLESGGIPQGPYVTHFDPTTEVWSELEAHDGSLEVPAPGVVLMHPIELGFWSLLLEDAHERGEAVFPQIVEKGPHGWWHQLHGVAGGTDRGAAIRIGVIDEALARQSSSSCIAHVQNLGGLRWASDSSDRAFMPQREHGHAICCLLSARRHTGVAGLEGIAPNAEILFAAAGLDDGAAIDPTRLANAIEVLAETYGCHLITISAGDDPEPTPEIEAAVETARDAGTLCLFAAGNQGEGPLYPARYEACLAVAAAGRLGTGPVDTTLRASEATASFFGEDDLYLWSGSAHGPGVELIAAGAGTFWCLSGRVARVAIGTSYAAPVATGVLAAQLARTPDYLTSAPDRARVDMALSVLRGICQDRGFSPHVSLGMPIAHV